MQKPKYSIPTMKMIRALKPNGFTVASTFSGCGGSSLGYRMAGFRVLWANEFVEKARDTYRANADPKTIIDERDIRSIQPGEVLNAIGLAAGDLDIFDGSPPCASFSMAGKRAALWGQVKKYSDTIQRTDDLFSHFARLLKGIQPKTFVAENVTGMVRGVAKGFFLEALAELRSAGYRVRAALLDAQWLGVPQARRRVIFIGVRSDLKIEPVHPTPLPYNYTIRDALPNIGWMVVEREADISQFAIGREWWKMGRPGTQSDRYFQLVRPALDDACPTITAEGGNTGAAGVTHPTECRKFSIAELKKLCGFPDDFVLTGEYYHQWERLGRAVPPPMMKAIAETIRDKILRRIK